MAEREEQDQARLAARARALEQAISGVRREIQSRPETPVTPAVQPAKPPLAGGGFELAALFDEHPDWRPLYEASEKADLLRRYAPFIHRRGLSPEQRDRFAGELVQHEANLAEIRVAANQAGWTADDARTAPLREKERERHKNDLAQLLGPQGYRELQEFDRSIALRDFVGELAQELYHTDTPLARDDAERLTQLLARHGKESQGKIARTGIDWDAALAEARDQLPPEHFAVLSRVRKIEELPREMNQIVARSSKRSRPRN